MRKALFFALLSTLLVACRLTPDRDRANVGSPTPGSLEGSSTSELGGVIEAPVEGEVDEGSGAASPDAERAVAIAGVGEGSAAGAPVGTAGDSPPPIRFEEQVCSSHDDCRVFQPGDWNPRVECCYEYRCDLDYVAVNTATWDVLRAWQRANPFDCVSHLRELGPCNSRSPRCGLVQDSPAASCANGICRVAYPTEWPPVDPSAQRCTSPTDCLAYRPSSSSLLSRCCQADCSNEWLAINTTTAEEIDRWRQFHAPACEPWRAENECPPMPECNLMPPSVTCRGGECVAE